MFDLIEEELSKKKEPAAQEGPVFSEDENPIYTMPSTSGGKLAFIIFGSLFSLAIVGTGIFLYVSSQKQPPVQAPVQQMAEQPAQEQPSAQAQTPVEQQAAPQSPPEKQPPLEQGAEEQGQQPQQVEQEQKQPLLFGVDTDQDGLTDSEERFYSTDPNKGDTDSDGFSDGNELKNLYDPLKAETRLDVSGIVNTYTNQTFKYSLLYPSSWVAKAVDPTNDREVMISSASGEFFTITVLDNPNKLSPVDWYTTVVAPGGDTARLQSFAYDTWSGVMTEDSLVVYLTRNEKDAVVVPLMYMVKYNLNTNNEIQLLTTFQMMLRSFIFTDLSFVK